MQLMMEAVVNHMDIDITKTTRKQRIGQYSPYNAFASNYFKVSCVQLFLILINASLILLL